MFSDTALTAFKFAMNDMLLPLACAFAVTAIVAHILIPFLKKIGSTQNIHEEVKAHQGKSGTPTMGGIAILCGILAGGLAAAFAARAWFPNTALILAVTFVFGAIGFLDDWFKIAKKRNLGLRARQKLALQIIVALAAAFYYIVILKPGTNIMIPFVWKSVDIGMWAIPYIVFIIVAMVNAVNLTDGLDGLASGVSTVLSLFFPVFVMLAFTLSLVRNDAPIVNMAGNAGAEVFFSSLAGACLGFLLFNRYPAKIFMGDTGSLAIGGGIAMAAIAGHVELLLPIAGFVFVIEALSDIIQVGSYKLRGGKRVFKMAPLHHHFELSGWHEKKVVAVFVSVTLVLCVAILIVTLAFASGSGLAGIE